MSAFIHGLDGPVVVVPQQVAKWLVISTDLRQHMNAAERETFEVLAAIVAIARTPAASATSAATGSEFGDSPEVPTRSEVMTSTEAADVLGIGDRAVRLACAEGRLPALRANGRWQIRPADVENYRRAA